MATHQLAVALAALLIAYPSFASQHVSGDAAVERGKYLVEDVAMCWMCHTPRNPDGSPDRQRWLMGGPVPFEPARHAEDWAIVVPRIAGLPPGTDEQFITLMTTGVARTGHPPRPPMPQFRMTRADAEAVLAYLKTHSTR